MALDATAAVIGAILGPIAGVIGSKVKVWLATRDARGRARQLMKEAGELLEFSDKLQQSANSGGTVTRIPPQSLENLQLAVKEKIEEVTEALSPAALAQARRQNLTQGILGRLFVAQRPRAWWGWILHAVYYAFLGITVLFAGLLPYDFHTPGTDREGAIAAVGIFAVATLILNWMASASSQCAPPEVPPPPKDLAASQKLGA